MLCLDEIVSRVEVPLDAVKESTDQADEHPTGDPQNPGSTSRRAYPCTFNQRLLEPHIAFHTRRPRLTDNRPPNFLRRDTLQIFRPSCTKIP